MASTQLKFDITVIETQKSYFVQCQFCDLPIDLTLQPKACPHCNSRTWLLNLEMHEACILYSRKPTGGRLKK